MPRIPNETSALVADLTTRLERLVAAARQEGRDAALSEVRTLVGGGAPSRERFPRTTSAPRGLSARKVDGRRNSWAGLTPEARLARVNAIRKGKGLPPKTKL